MKLTVGLVLAAVAVAIVSAGDPTTLSTKEEATKTTKSTKSSKTEKTGTASSSGIGSLFEDGSSGVIGDESAADGTVNPKVLNSIGITVPFSKAGSGLNLGPGEASSSSNSVESCPDACTMEYDPVTDENGKEYSNECAMRLAKCKGETGEKKKIVNFSVLDEPTVVKGTKEAENPATKTTKATKSTKSEKTGTASSSGLGSLFEDGSNGIISNETESGSADPTLVKGTKETPIEVTKAPVETATKTTKATKSTKSEKTGTASSSGLGSLFEDGSDGVIGEDSKAGSADPTLVKGMKEEPLIAEKTLPASKTKTILP